MFPGFSKVHGLCIVPNELLTLQVDPYTWSVLMYFAKRTYLDGEPSVQVTAKEIEEWTGISHNKLKEVLSAASETGYLDCQVSTSHDGNTYTLKFRDTAAVSTVEEARTESFREWMSKRVRAIVNDTTLMDKNARPLALHQRRLRAGLWAWDTIFGTDVPCDPKYMVEMISELGGSPVKVARWLLRYAEKEPWEIDEKPDQKMLAMLKGQLKRLGPARERRGKLGEEQKRQLPESPLPSFAS